MVTFLLVEAGFVVGLWMTLAYLRYRSDRRFERWLEEFTKMKKAETAEFIRRLENQ